MTTGLRLKEVRLQKKISLRVLSELSGIPKSGLAEIENHRQLLKSGEIEKIANALGVTVDELFLKR